MEITLHSSFIIDPLHKAPTFPAFQQDSYCNFAIENLSYNPISLVLQRYVSKPNDTWFPFGPYTNTHNR